MRDGGVPSVVIPPSAGGFYRDIAADMAGPCRLRRRRALDVKVARAAAEARSGVAFLRGIPGAVGETAAGRAARAYGGPVKHVFVSARAVAGDEPQVVTNGPAEMAFAYRRCGAPADRLHPGALCRLGGGPGRDPVRDAGITEQRFRHPQRSTPRSPSTLQEPARPLGLAAGRRGGVPKVQPIGAAQVTAAPAPSFASPSLGGATAADIETLGETVRERVKATRRGGRWSGRSSSWGVPV